MRLRKYHGLGNDYLVYEDGPEPTPALIRALCDRHVGPGADGVLLPGPGQSVRIFNPDGSEAERSGNGLRIFARWLVDHRGAPERLAIRTIAGPVEATVGEQVTLAMPPARLEGPLDPGDIDLPEAAGQVWLVEVGNPHCVLFVEADPDLLPWRDWGRLTERHPRFPERTNVQVARLLSDGRVEARIWERGAGETSASGTSACAVAVAARARGERAGTITVVMPGGELLVEPGDPLKLSGPVEEVYAAVVSPGWLARCMEAHAAR